MTSCAYIAEPVARYHAIIINHFPPAKWTLGVRSWIGQGDQGGVSVKEYISRWPRLFGGQDLHLQVHCPVGQPQLAPQEQEHPGPVRRQLSHPPPMPRRWTTHREGYG